MSGLSMDDLYFPQGKRRLTASEQREYLANQLANFHRLLLSSHFDNVFNDRLLSRKSPTAIPILNAIVECANKLLVQMLLIQLRSHTSPIVERELPLACLFLACVSFSLQQPTQWINDHDAILKSDPTVDPSLIESIEKDIVLRLKWKGCQNTDTLQGLPTALIAPTAPTAPQTNHKEQNQKEQDQKEQNHKEQNHKEQNQKEQDHNTGLHLKQKTIHQISGPVSMVYLKPRSNTFFGQERTHLPLVMLWGDVHRDDSGVCDPCSEEKGCYPIYDKAFLKHLDTLATDYPVDFYTEYSKDFPEYNNPKDILFRRFLKETTKACHQKNIRSTHEYEDRCPTKNIRWHYADPRFMKNTVEGILLYPIRAEFDLFRMIELFEKLEKESPPSAKSFLTFQVILQKIQAQIQQTSPHIRDVRSAMLEALLIPVSQQEILQKGIPHSKYYQLFAPFVDLIRDAPSYYPSVIQKQLNKLNHPLTREETIEFFVKTFVISSLVGPFGNPRLFREEQQIKSIDPTVMDFIRFFFTDSTAPTDSTASLATAYAPTASLASLATATAATAPTASIPNKGFQVALVNLNDTPLHPLLKAIHKKFGDASVKEIWFGFEKVVNYLFEVEIFFVDIYTILRMMKLPDEGSPPYLSLGFFGATHTHNITTILRIKPYFDYEVAYHKVDKDNRCITIQKSIPLAEDLEQHAQHILQTNKRSKQMLPTYKNILTKEAFGREASRLGSIQLGGSRRKTRKTRQTKKTKSKKDKSRKRK